MNRSRAAILLMASTAWLGAAQAADAPPSEQVAIRLQVPMPGLEGMRFTSAIVTFAPGARAAPHRHGKAFVYAYVLSGSVRSQLDATPSKVYRAGEEWTEPPGAHHRVTANTSTTRPARLLVVFVAPDRAMLKVPDQP